LSINVMAQEETIFHNGNIIKGKVTKMNVSD
jgi:hypothetical protein